MPTDVRGKLRILADSAKYDASCASGGNTRAGRAGELGSATPEGICHSYTPDGRCVSLLRILLTNACAWDCLYCVNRVSNDLPRASFEPQEVVALTLDFYRRNYVEGLFLSSAIPKNPDETMERMVEVARSLREDHAFRGYVHLKAIPGASATLLARAGLYADRLSANVELPTGADLARLAPEKTHEDVERAMGAIHAGREAASDAGAPPFAPAGQTTQVIVGATPSSDASILRLAGRLYDAHALARVYFSAYSPIPGADRRLPADPPPFGREHRLYEADLLIRRYGFSVEELFEGGAESLDPDMDPKLAWALRHREFFPVDANRAPRGVLLRVPGLGSRSVSRILAARRHRALGTAELARLRVPLRRALPFLRTADRNPATALLDRVDLAARMRTPVQGSLFEGEPSRKRRR